MPKKLFFVIAITAIFVMSFTTPTDLPHTKETTTEFVNCLAARQNAERQRAQVLSNGGSVSTANQVYCIVWSYSTYGQCGPCKYQ